MIFRFSLLCGLMLIAGCASTPTMVAPSDEEVTACEARGGSIEPAHAIDAYVCLPPPGESSTSAEAINYGTLQENPSPASVGSVIEQMPRYGAGEHHIELSYCTQASGVVLPPEVRGLHPTEITIVLQWQYWDLERVGDEIHVTLSFHQQPARIVIPLRAITSFRAPDDEINVHLRPGETSDQRCPERTSDL